MTRISKEMDEITYYHTVSTKQQIMTCMDTLLALIIVSPLVISHWRGTWTLMDIYGSSFPAWESFAFGGVLHLSFAVMRDSLHELIKFRTETILKVVFSYFVKRVYTYLFTAACIICWRGGWMIYDKWLGVELLQDGRASCETKALLSIGMVIVLLVLLIIFKSLRNSLAVPFVIGLDTKYSSVDFPTRFRIPIIITAFYVVNNEENILAYENSTDFTEDTIEWTPVAEKLIGPRISVEKQVIEHISPRPFLNNLRVITPAGFSVSFPKTTVPSLYPNHKPQPQKNPHNIQDILQYISKNVHRRKELIRNEKIGINARNQANDKFKVVGKMNTPTRKLSRQLDPFFPFKPQDPSEINLMAPNSFRFAPVIRPDLYNRRQKVQKETTQLTKIPSNGIKPLSLTLNIYPSPFDDQLSSENRPHFQGPGLTPRYNRYPSINFQGKPLTPPKKMVVHLNLYPGRDKVQADGEINFERRSQ